MADNFEFPRITVVTPTFNRAEYLEETIRSVVEQNYPELEYIIVDGGSTNPRVLEIIRKYQDRLAWWISERDSGHAEAIRKGFDRATGDILAWLCSDDLYLPGALRIVGETFRDHPEAEVVYGDYWHIDLYGNKLAEFAALPYCRLVMFGGNNLQQPAAFWRRELYQRVGGQLGGERLEYNVYEPQVELFARFVKASARFVRANFALTAMRVHPKQVTATDFANARRHSLRAMRQAYPYLSLPGIYQAIKCAMRIRQASYYLLSGRRRYLIDALRRRIALPAARRLG